MTVRQSIMEASMPELKKREVLLIEDAEADRRLLVRALQIAGVRNSVHHAHNGKEAMSYLGRCEAGSKEAPAVIFIDLKLPDMSGFEILKYLQERAAFRSSLKVVVSQMGDVASVKAAYGLGATTFLTKPPPQQELEELIRVYPRPWQVVAPGDPLEVSSVDKTVRLRR